MVISFYNDYNYFNFNIITYCTLRPVKENSSGMISTLWLVGKVKYKKKKNYEQHQWHSIVNLSRFMEKLISLLCVHGDGYLDGFGAGIVTVWVLRVHFYVGCNNCVPYYLHHSATFISGEIVVLCGSFILFLFYFFFVIFDLLNVVCSLVFFFHHRK